MRNVEVLALGVFFLLSALPIPAAQAEEIVRPNLTPEQFQRTREIKVQVQGLREKIREQLLDLLGYQRDAQDRPALLFRLADNYAEEAQAWINQAQELTDRLAKDPENQSLRRSISAKKKTLLDRAREWKLREIRTLKQIAEEYPHYPDLDRVLFFQAYSLSEINRTKEALGIYRKLILSFPESQFVPDAYLAFGEYYFDRGELHKALRAFKKVTEFVDSPLRPYALIMLGWQLYNLHDYSRAKRMFAAVARLSDIPKGIELRREALKAFTLAYSQEGSVKRAYRVFGKLAPVQARSMLRSLAGIYFTSGKDPDAIVAYRELIKLEKCSAEIPFYQSRILECTDRLGNPRNTVRQVRELVDAYSWTSGCLSSPTQAERTRLEEGRALVEKTLRRYAVEWYRKAKKLRQKNIFAFASEFFGDYLHLFPKSPHAYDMRFQHAEILFFRLGQNERAASEYQRVAASGGPRTCDAAYKSVEARRILLKQEPEKSRKIPRRQRELLAVSRIYLAHCPREEDACGVRFESGGLLFGLDRYDQAVELFDRAVMTCTDSCLAVNAYLAIVDSLEKDGDHEKLEKMSRGYLKDRRLSANCDLMVTIREKLPKIVFARISKMQKLEAAHAFVRFASEFPNQELADEALHNAATLFEKSSRLDQSARARLRLIRGYPDSDLYAAALFDLARNLERMARFKEATRAYERYARNYRKHGNRAGYHPAEAQQALINAGVYREALREYDKSVADRLLFVELFPRSEDAPGLLNTVGLLHARLGNFHKAAKVFKRLARNYLRRSPDLAIAAHMRRAEMLLKLDRRRSAELEMKTVLKLFKRARRRGKKLHQAAQAAAQADFLLARSLFSHYAEYRLTSKSEHRLKRQFAEKLRRLERVAHRYTNIVKRKQPEWAIASLYRLGLAYENLSNTLRRAGLPPDLYPEISQKAVVHYEAAVTKSSELGCYCEFTLLARKRLEKLHPEKYPETVPLFELSEASSL